MNRQFEVTTWDSLTGETDKRVVTVGARALDNPFDIAERIHVKLCNETQEDDQYAALTMSVAGDSLHPLHFITTWRAPDGSVSSENCRELFTTHAEPELPQ